MTRVSDIKKPPRTFFPLRGLPDCRKGRTIYDKCKNQRERERETLVIIEQGKLQARPRHPDGCGRITRNTFTQSSRKICKLPAAALYQRSKLEVFLKALT